MFTTGRSRLRMQQGVCAIVALVAVSTTQAMTIISEVLYDAASADNGNVFVELYGTPGTVLDDLVLEGINGADGSVYRSVSLTGVIPTGGVFLIGDDSGDGTSFISNADLVLDIDFQNGPDSVVLRDSSSILDAIGYGDFTGLFFAGEGSPAPDAPAGFSLARRNPLTDTNDNLADFVELVTPTPGGVPTSVVPVPPAVVLFLSGILGLVGVARKQNMAGHQGIH